MSFETALRALEEAHEDEVSRLEDERDTAFESGREQGEDEGFKEGEKRGRELVDDFARRLLDKLAQLRMGAELPMPLNGITMTLDEIERMIKEG